MSTRGSPSFTALWLAAIPILLVAFIALFTIDDTKPFVPAEARSLVNPFAGHEESWTYGQLVYDAQCAMCHGSTGEGSGAVANRLELTMPDLCDEARQRQLTDGEYFWIVSKGRGPAMRGEQDRLTEETRWHLVNYLRQLPKERAGIEG